MYGPGQPVEVNMQWNVSVPSLLPVNVNFGMLFLLQISAQSSTRRFHTLSDTGQSDVVAQLLVSIVIARLSFHGDEEHHERFSSLMYAPILPSEPIA